MVSGKKRAIRWAQLPCGTFLLIPLRRIDLKAGKYLTIGKIWVNRRPGRPQVEGIEVSSTLYVPAWVWVKYLSRIDVFAHYLSYRVASDREIQQITR